MYDYFKKDANDIAFYEAHIKNRLPEKIIDAHVHMNLPEHVLNVSQETIKADWALECGLEMSFEDTRSLCMNRLKTCWICLRTLGVQYINNLHF